MAKIESAAKIKKIQSRGKLFFPVIKIPRFSFFIFFNSEKFFFFLLKKIFLITVSTRNGISLAKCFSLMFVNGQALRYKNQCFF